MAAQSRCNTRIFNLFTARVKRIYERPGGAALLQPLVYGMRESDIDSAFVNKHSLNWWCNDIIQYNRPALSVDLLKVLTLGL